MRKKTPFLILGVLLLLSLGCTITLPSIPLPEVPTLKTGPMQEYREEIPLETATETTVNIRIGVGELTLEPGDPETLFSGLFRTNVSAWVPTIVRETGRLTVEQPSVRGVPQPGAENEWEIRLAPRVPLRLRVTLGAARGRLDLTGLALTDLSIETGASDLTVRTTGPNPATLERFLLRAGAANAEITGIGYLRPRRVSVEGGVGNLTLDFAGPWTESADIDIKAGVGSITLRFPQDVGARVLVEGNLGNIQADPEWRLSGSTYVNKAYGTSPTTLNVTLLSGIGNVRIETSQ
ncbi:MAG: toast rack family protein [Anaerolineae bacterium]|nr:toast rack family protein [Anaerolineae bacterium]